jgi:hypothetical protein
LDRRRWRASVITFLEASSLTPFVVGGYRGKSWERKFSWVAVSTLLASEGIISFLKAPLLHPPPGAVRCCTPPPFAGVLLCELLLRCCFGPPNSDAGVAVLVGVVVARSSSVTDVVFGSTSSSRCRACDAPSRMLCRVGLGGRLGRLSVASSPPRLHLLSWLHCVVLVDGPVSHFLAVSLCLSLLLGFQPPSLWFVTGAGVSP